jgi:hypothetical protein
MPMMQSVMVQVTQEDIARGERWAAFRCPVAFAAERAGLGRKGVTNYDILVRGKIIPLPGYVTEWINAYDAGCLVEPIRFSIEVPEDGTGEAP